MPLAPLGQWYVHARSGAAQALLALGEERRARELAEAELADVRRFGGPDRNRADTGEAALASLSQFPRALMTLADGLPTR